MKAFTSLFVAHYRQFVRDRAALFFTFFFPIMFIMIFGWVFGDPGLQTFDIGLIDQDASQTETSQTAKTIKAGLEAVGGGDDGDGDNVFGEIRVRDWDTHEQSLRDGELSAVIIVPEGSDYSLGMGQPIALEVYYDPSQTANEQILLPILNQVIGEIDWGMQGSMRLIGLQEHSIQSHQLRYIDYLVPGILGMSLMFTGIFGCVPIIQQRQAQIIKRLGTTPLRRSTLVFSELAFRMILVLLTAALIVAVGRLAFDVQMVGSWWSLCGITVLGTLAFVSIGYVIAAFIRTEEGAIPIINVITFPMMFLSGTFFEVQNMPDFIEPVVDALPLTYLSDALRQIMVDGAPLHPMTTDIAVMAGWLVICLAISIRFFRWD